MIGENLKKIRESQNLGVNELSRLSKVNASYISAIERGEKNNPSPKILEKLSIALNVSTEDFFKENELSESISNHTDLTKEITDVEQAMKLILAQPGVMLNGELLTDGDKIKVANAILMGIRFAAEQIEKEKKDR